MHGAGHSAMSFAAMTKYLKEHSIVTAFDFRGHGSYFRDDETDLKDETLIRDSIEVIKHVCGMFNEQSVIIVGHSMGGSIATKAVVRISKEYGTE